MKKYVIALFMVMFLAACAQPPAEVPRAEVLPPAEPMTAPGVDDVEEMVVVEEPGEKSAGPESRPLDLPPPPSAPGMETQAAEPSVKEITVRAFQFGYDPETIEVNVGDTVRISAYTSDAPHGFALPEFGFDLGIASTDPNNPDTAEFVADKAGEYRFYCSIPCGKGHKGMSGKLIVKP
jgi:plastocyanin